MLSGSSNWGGMYSKQQVRVDIVCGGGEGAVCTTKVRNSEKSNGWYAHTHITHWPTHWDCHMHEHTFHFEPAVRPAPLTPTATAYARCIAVCRSLLPFLFFFDRTPCLVFCAHSSAHSSSHFELLLGTHKVLVGIRTWCVAASNVLQIRQHPALEVVSIQACRVRE